MGSRSIRARADIPRTSPPRSAGEWLDGETVAFLIDFLDGQGAVEHRIYYQDAVVAAPWGFAPDDLIAEHPVDLAILVPATFDQVDWHPEAFVENLRPRRSTSWALGEFLRADLTNGPKPSCSPTSSHFERRLTRVFDGEWWRPEIGTVFRFPSGG